jgi:periplasmic copper chaperone A
LRKWIVVFFMSTLLPGLAMAESGDAGDEAEAADGTAKIENAWVRALPPTQKMTAGYLRLSNNGESAFSVVGASSDIAKMVEIHTTVEVEGLMRMQQLESVAVGPGESVEFSPGGTHLMFMGLLRMPRPGEEVQICLQLASGGEVCTVASAQKSGPESAGAHKHH